MPLSRTHSRKGAKAAPAAPGTGQRLLRHKGRTLLTRAKAGTVKVVRVTHAAWRAVGHSATSLFTPKPVVRVFNPGLLDRLHAPLSWRREG